MSAIRDYLSDIQNEFKTGIAGEHAYRPALKTLLESLEAVDSAVNDPARDETIGMPDFVALRQPGNVPIGIVEAKDIGNQLSRSEKSAQIKRYMKFGNLLLTNYLEFRWYVDGEKRETVRIARVRQGEISRISSAYHDLADLLRRFAEQKPANVNSAQELAQRLARNTQLIAHFIKKDLKSSAPSPNLENQMAAFANTLIPDLDIVKFADMYAQTLAYGLFAARVNYPGDPAQFSLSGAAEYIPRTNPFLRKLFYFNSFDLGSRLTWLVESLVALLQHTDIDSILDQFGKRTGQTDPVVHFYETFLSAYNPSLRETRGVYYTPEPVVKYIVRSVDHILKTRFERPLGLADKDTLILDPAVGTGTFLYHVIEQIKERFEGQQGMWKDYVEERLLPRIFGFELLMAPYTVAHMNLGLQLKEAGYEFKENERLGIYLTNSLEEGVKQKYESAFGGFIEDEANAAAEIKRDKPIMVVLGNPPYSGHSANRGEWIGKLVRDYYFVDGKPLGERNPKWLQDDYVKFIRFGQWRIEQTGEGVLAFITNNSYLDALTFRGMRQHLLGAFNTIYIMNLHGSVKRNTSPDGGKDDNVFDIQQGVSVIILLKDKEHSEKATVFYCDIWGGRADKYAWLIQHDILDTDWQTIEPSSPYYFFIPTNANYEHEYNALSRIPDAMPVNSVGVVTGQDRKVISMRLADINDVAQENSVATEYVKKIDYRLFDTRYILYHGDFVTRTRKNVMRHMLKGCELALICTRQQSQDAGWSLIGVSDSIIESSYLSNKTREINYLSPLYLYPRPDQFDDTGDDPGEYPLSDNGRRPNLSKAFVSELEAKLGLPFETEGSAFANGDSPDWFGPEDVFYYAYAIFHSPTYRERYAEFLKIDFPRLPLTSDVCLFAALVKLGAELVGLHLMKSPKLAELITTFDKEGDDEVARGYPKYTQKGGRVHINRTQYFGGIPQEIWDFHIGGYQVLQKWLKDRRGRKLSLDEREHYQKIVVALSETIRIMSAIDAAIPQFPLE